MVWSWERSAALADGFCKRATRERRCHECADGDGTRGFAKDGDVGRVSTEGGDVCADPFECGGLIEETVVAGGVVGRLGGEFGMDEESEDAEAVIHGHHDDVSMREKLA